MAVMDSNGNGDGWNNVSPFGDNGNGAYPGNPNLEQYYGYGGAWGYLYFGRIFGGTNTVRSVDFIISMDGGGIRIWASSSHPTRRGIICMGDGQDAVNKEWLRSGAMQVGSRHLVSMSWNI